MKTKQRYWQSKNFDGDRQARDGRKLFGLNKNDISSEFAMALNLNPSRTPSLSPEPSLIYKSTDSLPRGEVSFVSFDDRTPNPYIEKHEKEYASVKN